ncbi:hypothetical protein [Bacteriophage sp.]|nr:hypothetical protein [Bacteriophage sp.]UOF80135.1 hypothetical protein [Bacteriophage sp.]
MSSKKVIDKEKEQLIREGVVPEACEIGSDAIMLFRAGAKSGDPCSLCPMPDEQRPTRCRGRKRSAKEKTALDSSPAMVKTALDSAESWRAQRERQLKVLKAAFGEGGRK